MRMAESGLPVPVGAVLTTRLFAPWFDEIRASPARTVFRDAVSEDQEKLCNDLQRICPVLALTGKQQQPLQFLQTTAVATGDALFAVRSSSPNKALAAASFSGGSITRLGVRAVDLEQPGRACFTSTLAE